MQYKIWEYELENGDSVYISVHPEYEEGPNGEYELLDYNYFVLDENDHEYVDLSAKDIDKIETMIENDLYDNLELYATVHETWNHTDPDNDEELDFF